MLEWVDDLGRRVVAAISYTLDLLLMIYLSFRATLFNKRQSFQSILSVIFSQVYFTGVQALPLISALAIGASGIIVLQSSSHFNILGGSGSVGQLMVAVIVREVAPLMTALIVIARSGTAIASELGNMKVNREIEALEVMGINPLSFIIFPRLVGGIISVLCLSLYFIYVAIGSGYLSARFLMNMPFDFYIDSIMQVFAFDDVYLFALKNIFSGAITFSVCCHQGLQAKQGPHEVPQVTTKAVMNSIIYVILFNLSVTILFYLKQLMQLGVF